MRSLTALEAEFLKRLKQAVSSQTKGQKKVKGVFLTNQREDNPSLQIGLRLDGAPALTFFKVMIYGTRPVRYHLEAKASEYSLECRSFFNRLLGAFNLVTEKSGEKGDRYHLFYQVRFPDKELKQLGEK